MWKLDIEPTYLITFFYNLNSASQANCILLDVDDAVNPAMVNQTSESQIVDLDHSENTVGLLYNDPPKCTRMWSL